MSMTFSDTQLKATSKDILLIPFLINAPVTGYNAQKATLQEQSLVLQADDVNKTNFYNFWKSVVVAYQTEREHLNGLLDAVYSDADLSDAGLQKGNHYPMDIPVWTYMSPKQLPSMTGLPQTASAIIPESSRIADATTYSNYLQNGFADGADTSAVTSVTLTEFTHVSGVNPIVGNRIIINDGSNSLFGIVTDISSLPTISYTFLGGVLVSSGTCRNFHAAFTNSERSHATTNYANDVMVFFENQLSAAITNWKANFDAQKIIIDANGDYAPNKVTNILASADIFSLNLTITGWASLTYNTKYIDSGLLIIQSAISARSPQLSPRISQLTANLGTLSQTSGVFSGSGAYLSLSEIINIRVSRTGSLCKYNGALLGISYFDKLIADSNTQLAQYEQTMVVKTITQDVSISDIVIKVDDVSQLSIGNNIKLFDNDSNVYSRTISNIVGLNVTLNLAMVAPLSISKLARLTKEL